jgi:rare lipoprotein A (peptidoglycan hydrolase)
VRPNRVVARAVLIAVLASVVVPGLAGSRIPSAPAAIDPSAFHQVGVDQPVTAATTPYVPNPQTRSAGSLNADAVLREPSSGPVGTAAPRPVVKLPATKPIVQEAWRLDSNISWYGPGFYGNNGACGMIPGGLQPDTVGVAHRTLPCGTKVTFRYNGRTVTTMVIDRGPYVAGRIWDMTHGLCALLNHCFTGGGVYYRIG